jgi:hypothetical protein
MSLTFSMPVLKGARGGYIAVCANLSSLSASVGAAAGVGAGSQALVACRLAANAAPAAPATKVRTLVLSDPCVP